MGYDRGDHFPFDFVPNGIPFGANAPLLSSFRATEKRCNAGLSYVQPEISVNKVLRLPKTLNILGNIFVLNVNVKKVNYC